MIEQPRYARSRQMANCLRQEGLYSETRAPDLVFSATERLLARSASEPMMVSRLTREAARGASLAARDTGYEFGNWIPATKAVIKTLLMAGCLVDPDGEPIPFGVQAHAARVAALTDDYRDRAETYLLETIISRLGDVTVHDHTPLAHALFRQFDRCVPMHDLEDRVAILAARLADRVALDGDTYVMSARRPSATSDTAEPASDTADPASSASPLRD